MREARARAISEWDWAACVCARACVRARMLAFGFGCSACGKPSVGADASAASALKRVGGGCGPSCAGWRGRASVATVPTPQRKRARHGGGVRRSHARVMQRGRLAREDGNAAREAGNAE
eukprot:4882410-Pleurochrysis_carterae.AAC.1